MVIEVKTDLDQKAFGDVLGMWGSVYWLPVTMLGFAYDGVQFQTFCDYIRSAVREAPCGLPECLAVHKQNYLYVRARYRGAENPSLPNRRRTTKCQFLVDLAAAGMGEGTAPALFLHWQNELLTNSLMPDDLPLRECRELGVSGDHICIIDDD